MTVLTSLQVGSVLSYVIAVVVPALDAVFPLLPSETTIIALGVATAGSTDPRIALLVACCALGAFLGDNLSYLLGKRFGPWAERRFFPGRNGARRRAWAERSLRRHGMPLIVVCRFVPGGRTAVTLCCGIIGYPRRRFAVATAVAGSIWAIYSFYLGRLGGKAFEDRPWVGLPVAFGVTVAVSGLVEVIRRIRKPGKPSAERHAGQIEADAPGAAAAADSAGAETERLDAGRIAWERTSSGQGPLAERSVVHGLGRAPRPVRSNNFGAGRTAGRRAVIRNLFARTLITERVLITTYRPKKATSGRRKRRLGPSRRDPGQVTGP